MDDLFNDSIQKNVNKPALMSEDEIKALQSQTPNWAVKDFEGVNHLIRSFKFDNFVNALHFTNQIGKVAEEQGHHPLIHLTWGRVTVEWWTHDLNGLGRNDFIMAAKTDYLYEKRVSS